MYMCIIYIYICIYTYIHIHTHTPIHVYIDPTQQTLECNVCLTHF